MSDPDGSTVASCIPVETPEHQALLAKAREILAERGEDSLVEELSRPVTYTFPPDVLPYISLVLQEAAEQHFRLEAPAPSNLQPGVYPLHEVALSMSPVRTMLKTSCESIDNLFGGGIPVGTSGIIEISGKAGVGKTQLAMQIALMTPAPLLNGGLQSPAIYAFTEGQPPISRMAEIDATLSDRFSIAQKTLMHGVIVEKLDSSDALLTWAETRLPYLLRDTRARVVVLDSVTAVYRPEFEDALSRAGHLVRMATALRRAVDAVSGVCICVNQVSQAMDGLQSLNATVPALGSAWSNCVSTRLFLSRLRQGDERRFAKVLHSSYLPPSEDNGEPYRITKDGVVADG